MRILQISHYYPPETHGGTQEYVAELAALQQADGHDVHVLAGSREDSTTGDVQQTVEDGIPVRRILRDGRTERVSGDLGSERLGTLVEQLAARIDPDIVHVHHWHALSRDIVQRLTSGSRTVVVTLHDLFTTCPRFFRMPDARTFCRPDVTLDDCASCLADDLAHLSREGVVDLLTERRVALQAELSAADAVLTVSAPQRELLLSIPGFQQRELRALPIGIRGAAEPPTAPEPVPGRLRIVNWAGLDPRKGIHLLLAAVAACKRRDDLSVHLYGRPGEPAYMDELAGLAAGLDVTFHGPYEDSQRGLFAGRYDLAVFPFLAFETYGLVVDEALRSGIPVVVSDHGAPPARIGQRGLACPRDPRRLAQVFEGLLDEPERLARMRAGSHAARDLTEHHAELSRLYASLLERRES